MQTYLAKLCLTMAEDVFDIDCQLLTVGPNMLLNALKVDTMMKVVFIDEML